jgi:hypothetical protein
MGDYLADLDGYTADNIATACATYRRNAEYKYYPRSGEILALLNQKQSEFDRDSGPRIPWFEGLPPMNGPRATKSVAEVLLDHGFSSQARKWENNDYDDKTS